MACACVRDHNPVAPISVCGSIRVVVMTTFSLLLYLLDMLAAMVMLVTHAVLGGWLWFSLTLLILLLAWTATSLHSIFCEKLISYSRRKTAIAVTERDARKSEFDPDMTVDLTRDPDGIDKDVTCACDVSRRDEDWTTPLGNIVFWICHGLPAAPVFRWLECFRKVSQRQWSQFVWGQEWDASDLRWAHTYLQTAPLVTLHLHILLVTLSGSAQNYGYPDYSGCTPRLWYCVLIGFLSLTLGETLLAWTKHMFLAETWLLPHVSLVHFIWQMLMLAPRLLALACLACASRLGFWLLILLHFLLVAVIEFRAVKRRTRPVEYFNLVIRAVNGIFSCNTFGTNRYTRVKYLVMYSLFVIEDVIVVSLWYVWSPPGATEGGDWAKWALVLIVVGAPLLGVGVQVVYYMFLHPETYKSRREGGYEEGIKVKVGPRILWRDFLIRGSSKSYSIARQDVTGRGVGGGGEGGGRESRSPARDSEYSYYDDFDEFDDIDEDEEEMENRSVKRSSSRLSQAKIDGSSHALLSHSQQDANRLEPPQDGTAIDSDPDVDTGNGNKMVTHVVENGTGSSANHSPDKPVTPTRSILRIRSVDSTSEADVSVQDQTEAQPSADTNAQNNSTLNDTSASEGDRSEAAVDADLTDTTVPDTDTTVRDMDTRVPDKDTGVPDESTEVEGTVCDVRVSVSECEDSFGDTSLSGTGPLSDLSAANSSLDDSRSSSRRGKRVSFGDIRVIPEMAGK